MRLSKSTVDILKSFTNINQSILFKAGNVISTRSVDRTIVARAEIVDEFPKEFAVWDLPRLISILSLYKGAELSFHDTHLEIDGDDQKLTFNYTDPTTIVTATYGDFKLDIEPVEFHLSESTLSTALKAASILQVPDLLFEGRDEEVSVTAHDTRTQSGGKFSKITTKGKGKNFSFKVKLKLENFKLPPNNYTVNLFGDRVIQFTSAYDEQANDPNTKQIKLDYWFALQAT